MKAQRIFHLEDDPEWVEHLKILLGDTYDVYSASNPEEAAQLFVEMAGDGLKFDLAIIDISLILGDPSDKQGFQFTEALQSSGVMRGHSIIVLSGYSEVDQNLRVAFRDYDVIDVFDKGNFLEERSQFKQVIAETVERLRSIELLLPLTTAWSEAGETLEFAQQFEAAIKRILELSFGRSAIEYKEIPSQSSKFIAFSLDTGTVFEGISSLSRLPAVFCRFRSLTQDNIDYLRHFLSETAPSFPRMVLLIIFADPAHLQELQHLLDRKLNRAYAYDVVIMRKETLESILTSENPSRTLRRFVLAHVDLRNVSPFIITGPTDDSVFFGREPEIREIAERLPDMSFAVIGGRRMGKSSLLRRLHRLRLPTEGLRTLYHDCSTTPTYNTFLAAAIRDWRPQAPPSVPATFEDLFESPLADRPLVLLLDEADKLVPADRTDGWRLFKTLRALVNSSRVQVILSGERTLRDALRDPKSPLFNFANEMLLGPLDFRAVEELVTRPMKQLEIELADEKAIVDCIWAFTSGHPNVVQRLCRRLIERLNEQGIRRITLDDVNAVIEDPSFQRDDFLSTYWEAATSLEKIISLLIADDESVRTLRAVRQALAERCNLHPKAREVDDALQRLVDLRSILKRTPTGYEFAVEAFPRVVAGTMTLDDMLEVLVEDYAEEQAKGEA